MAQYEDLRQGHLAELTTLLPEHVQRLRWPADRLRRERRDRLGVPGPAVEVRPVDRLERQAAGKVRRHLPLTGVVELTG
jgi:hypothetical protein